MCCCTIKKLLTKIFKYLWGLFLNGLLTILPITFTIVILSISYNIIDNWLEPVRGIKPEFLNKIPHAEIIIIVLSIFFLGTILKIFLLTRIIHSLEDLIVKIPIIRSIYLGTKQLVQAFGTQDQISFKQVVMIEFPRKGIYCLGFLTSELPTDLAPKKEEHFFNIFVPTTPNPTSGYFIILAEKDITNVKLTRQEAMAMIISGGIIQPDRLKK